LNRFNDLYRELQRHDIHESVISLFLINEQNGTAYFPGSYYGKIRVFQDNPKDRLIKKLRNNRETANNYVFGR